MDNKRAAGPTPTTLMEQAAINSAFAVLAPEQALLPIKVTPFYKRKIDEEVRILGHTNGPLHRGSYPTKERLTMRAPSEVPDFVTDRDNMKGVVGDNIIRKYANRILFTPTSFCAGHCQYCFRQDLLSGQHGADAINLTTRLAALLDYLTRDEGISEVILSGGDPMTLPASQLEEILNALGSVESITSIRIHTRTIVFSPQIFSSRSKLKLLATAKVRLVFHIVHPYELCPTVMLAIHEIQAAGIRCYNQFPVLRGINDNSIVLASLLELLDDNRVRNLSIFIPDPINYSASFRVRLSRIFELMAVLNEQYSSWINSTRLVLDTPVGKVRRENLIGWRPDDDYATFEREGKKIVYPDLPNDLDIPGDLPTLLWRSRHESSN